MNLFRIKYLKYILFSRHGKGHGIHSPFVFDLITRVFRNKIYPDVVLMIENIRKKNRSDVRIISVTDLGAGSSRMERSIRKVSDIVRYSAVPQKYGILLTRLAAEFGRKSIIELGTSAGISTMYLASGSPDSIVYTIEGCPATAEIAKENFDAAGLKNIRVIIGSFDDRLPELIEKSVNPGLVFIDGNHRKEQTIKYFTRIADISDKGTVIIIDDIHASGEMEEAWSEIRNYEKVSLSIDIFRMGLLFFRQGGNHFNYVIRY